MRVAIAQVDGKWPNLALAKIAALHRSMGDDVELFNPLLGADVVYAGKVFTNTPDDRYLPGDAIRGGTGYDFSAKLDKAIEAMKPDWSLWPWWKDDLGFTTRGCVRRCEFCFVPRKEGRFRVVAEFGDISTGRPRMILHDNNATAAPIEHFRKLCLDATESGVELDFRQGLDARLFTDEHASILAQSKISLHIHMAFDNVADEKHIRRAITTCRRNGLNHRRLTFYVLIGFDSSPDEDLYRVRLLDELGCDAYVMPYGRTPYERAFTKWNNGHAKRNVPWSEFVWRGRPAKWTVERTA